MSKMTMGAGIAIAGLALLQPGGTAAQAGAAASGAAQGQQLPPGESSGGPAQQPAQQPGQQPPAAPTAQAPAAQQAGTEVAQRLQHLHWLNMRSIGLARVAAELGTSERVRTFGQNISQFHSDVDARVRQLASARAAPVGGAESHAATAQQEQMSALQGKPRGPELDGTIVDQLVEQRVLMVDQLKQLRDATPGKDAELKSWLDQVENELEGQRNLARQIRQELRSQREARPATR